MKFKPMIQAAVGSLLFAAVVLTTGCDSGGDDGNPEVTQRMVSGVVTDDAGFSKTASGPIAGAAVEAVSFASVGTGNRLEGSTTTDASGAYSLDIETAGEILVVMATKATFSTSSMVQLVGSGDVTAMPVIDETDAEADIFVGARDQGFALMPSQVAFAVDTQLAAEIKQGNAGESDVATAINDGDAAEDEYTKSGDDAQPDERRMQRDDERKASFIELQSALAAGTDDSAAVRAFESRYAMAALEAGIPASVQARAAQANRLTVMSQLSDLSLSADAQFAMKKQLALYASTAVKQSTEAAFEAHGSANGVLAQLDADGEAMLDAIASASSESELDAALSGYNASVETQLRAEANVTGATITAAKSAVDLIHTTLDTALAAATTASARVTAMATFYSSAETAIETSFAGNSNAAFCAEVLTVLELQ